MGSVPEYDYAKIRLSIDQYRLEKLAVEQDRAHSLYALGAAMGTNAPVAVQPLPPWRRRPMCRWTNWSAAFPARPDVRSAAKKLSAQESAVQRAGRERWPDLSLAADYGYSGMQAQDIAVGWEFSALAHLPLYDFGTVRQREGAGGGRPLRAGIPDRRRCA